MSIPVQAFERRTRNDRRRSEPHPITDDIAAALTANAIEVRFQPQFHAMNNALAGAEALVRYEHPVRGVLAGDSLVAIAQGGGLARRMSRYIARAALSEAVRWPDSLKLSLNVTAMDLADRSFAADLLVMIEDAGLSPGRLSLEITEQALVADLDHSAAKLSELADTGIKIALDDFGAGFCNFHYLKVLPLDSLKLDRAMLHDITEDTRDLAVMRAIVAMAKALGLTVIAEGIEDEAQRQAIANEGCDIWQGFLGAEPLPAAEFAALIGG